MLAQKLKKTQNAREIAEATAQAVQYKLKQNYIFNSQITQLKKSSHKVLLLMGNGFFIPCEPQPRHP
jgi:hypothetical protein